MQKSDDDRSPLRKSLPDVTNELGSHLYLYQILDETPNGVMVVSLEHQVLYANPAANDLLGVDYRDLEELIRLLKKAFRLRSCVSNRFLSVISIR